MEENIKKTGRVVTIPKFLHELFGVRQQRNELVTIAVFAITSTLIVAWCTSDYWLTLKWYQATILWLLFLDIAGGIVANLSIGTNDYYNANPKKRWIFIAVNMQPLILAVVLQSTFSIAVGVWGYTIVSASIVNMLRRKTYHRLLASGLFAAAIIGYILLEISLPLPITLVYLLYMMKLIVCFAVEYPGDKASAVDH